MVKRGGGKDRMLTCLTTPAIKGVPSIIFPITEIARRMDRVLSLDELVPGTDTVTSPTFSLDNNI